MTDEIREGHSGDAMKRVCDNCLREFPGAKKCAACGNVYYCSVSCQKTHWKKHKLACQRMKEAAEQYEMGDFPRAINFLQDILLGTTVTLNAGPRNTMTNSEAAVFGIDNICHMAAASTTIRKNLMKAVGRDGVEVCGALMAVLRMHSNDPNVQRRGIFAIARLSDNEKMRTTLGEVGAVEVLAAALRKFVRDDVTVQNVFDSIGGLTLAHPTNIKKVLDAALLKPMNIAARLHKDKSLVAVMFFQCVGSLCEMTDEDAQSQLGACGTCETVFEMMAAQQQHWDVLGHAMGPLRYLSADHVENSVLLYELGAFEVIVRVLNGPGVNYMVRSTGHRAFKQISNCLWAAELMPSDELGAIVTRVYEQISHVLGEETKEEAEA